MTTATEELMRVRDEERDNNVLNIMIRDFIKRYEPEEMRDRLDFEMALHNLIRAVYKEASKPYEKILSAAVQSMSLKTLLTPISHSAP